MYAYRCKIKIRTCSHPWHKQEAEVYALALIPDTSRRQRCKIKYALALIPDTSRRQRCRTCSHPWHKQEAEVQKHIHPKAYSVLRARMALHFQPRGATTSWTALATAMLEPCHMWLATARKPRLEGHSEPSKSTKSQSTMKPKITLSRECRHQSHRLGHQHWSSYTEPLSDNPK